MLLQEPDILLLDESTSALDANAAADFHLALDERLPGAVILAVLHTSVPPHDPEGRPFYNQTLVLTPSVALASTVADPGPDPVDAGEPEVPADLVLRVQ
jgi:ABC-type molybdenum transport system ATPase subunit/photorepair protein PhrA